MMERNNNFQVDCPNQHRDSSWNKKVRCFSLEGNTTGWNQGSCINIRWHCHLESIEPHFSKYIPVEIPKRMLISINLLFQSIIDKANLPLLTCRCWCSWLCQRCRAALSSSVSNTIQSIPLKSPNSRAHKILTEVGGDDWWQVTGEWWGWIGVGVDGCVVL